MLLFNIKIDMNNLRRMLLTSSGGGDGREMIDGYEVVDLGLPSGILWATYDVGATAEGGYGKYYRYGKGSATYSNSQTNYTGTENPLSSSKDTATVVMGSDWHMPTITQCQELMDNTNYEWTTINGVTGAKLTSKTNPNAYVFFPASGFYYEGSLMFRGTNVYIMSSTPNTSKYKQLYILYSSGYQKNEAGERSTGMNIRGVHAAL